MRNHSDKSLAILFVIIDNIAQIWSFRYQKQWFQCPGTQVYSLSTYTCVDACEASEVKISSTKIHGLTVCRPPEYYVNPLSTEILELGTKLYPYKDINLVYIELFNFLKNLDITVRVNLLDDMDYVLYHEFATFYNMKEVIFQKYTISRDYTSGKSLAIMLYRF